jgi:hypothetical protein
MCMYNEETNMNSPRQHRYEENWRGANLSRALSELWSRLSLEVLTGQSLLRKDEAGGSAQAIGWTEIL